MLWAAATRYTQDQAHQTITGTEDTPENRPSNSPRRQMKQDSPSSFTMSYSQELKLHPPSLRAVLSEVQGAFKPKILLP